MNATKGSKLANAGAVSSALAASICCFGPLLLALLGLGGGALLLKFEPYRPVFLWSALLFLGVGFYLAYRRLDTEACEPGSSCSSPPSRRKQRITLWIVAIIVAIAAAFPRLSSMLF
jgi:mercuric ion transport protein